MNRIHQLSERDFDGHPDKPLAQMSAKEKLLWLSAQIELHRFIKSSVRRKEREKGES